MNSQDTFEQFVKLKYQLFNSLFITLPFQGTSSTGHFLPLLASKCGEGLKQNATPAEILEAFFRDNYADLNFDDRVDLLFRFVQYIERQVVLFDAIEDAAFNKVTDTSGKGTMHHFFQMINSPAQKDAFVEKIKDFGVRIVLTAHPTQFYPGNVLSIITDLESAIRRNNVQEINQLIHQLGLTPMYRRKKPTPLDEAIALIWYLENIFYQTVGTIIGNLKNQLPGVEINPSLIRLGFWPGGDRDGNPFVTSETTLTTARKLKESVLRAYLSDVRLLKRKLTFPETDGAIRRIENKLQTTIYGLDEQCYCQAEHLITDLQWIKQKLDADYQSIHADLLEALIDRIKAFGFFFAEMDIRQDSRVHRQIANDILVAVNKVEQYESCSTLLEKVTFWSLLNVEGLNSVNFEGITGESIRTIEVLRTIHKENGSEACRRYIISNTRNAEDLFILHFLFRAAGWDDELPFDLIPLFETIDDLEASSEVMDFLYSHPFYKKHLLNRGNKQTIMLGFSDGTKDGGYLAANWSIFKAKKQLTDLSRKYDVKVLFFDGRGGPPARGGGDTHAYYAAHGRHVENHEIQLTIQGQTISSKFGNHDAAQYNIEQLLTAGLSNHVFPSHSQDLSAQQEALMDELSQLSLKSYVELKEHPSFIDYLDQVTVLNFYGETNVGSRPSKRGKTAKLNLDDLRAIPFVGAWAQMKQNVPGYYGFGSALRQVDESGRGEQLRELYQQSLFFRALVYNSMQALAKTRFELTSYLKNNPEFGGFWQVLKSETDLTVQYLLKLSGYDRLLQEAPINLCSIQMREDIVLPLLVIQQFALNRYRAAIEKGEDAELWKKLVVRCFFGNINASRNSA